MATDLRVVPSVRFEDLAPVAATLRELDVRECWLARRESAYDAVRRSVGESARVATARLGPRPLAVLGVAPVAPGVGSVWMLSTREVNRAPKAFLRACRAVFPWLVAGFDYLENHVLAEYEAAVRWARWLGFAVDPPAPWGPFGAPFCRIRWEV